MLLQRYFWIGLIFFLSVKKILSGNEKFTFDVSLRIIHNNKKRDFLMIGK